MGEMVSVNIDLNVEATPAELLWLQHDAEIDAKERGGDIRAR
jgi:hypothetical protein